MLSNTPFTAADFDMPGYMYPDTTGFADTAEVVLLMDSVGAAFRLTCAGEWVTQRDTITRDAIGRFLNNMREGSPIGKTGFMDNAAGQFWTYTATQIGDALGLADTDSVTVNPAGATPTVRYVGPDTLATVTNCTDADGDGMPAAYESQYAFLDDSDPSDLVYDGDWDGYTALEEYLNGTHPGRFTSADDGSEASLAPASTYQDSIRIHTAPVTSGTHPVFGTYNTWSEDSIPAGGSGRYCIDSDASPTRVMFITRDTLGQTAPVDSAYADSVFAAWSRAGCDTASVKNDPIP